jgi:hypothetical protein
MKTNLPLFLILPLSLERRKHNAEATQEQTLKNEIFGEKLSFCKKFW